jgi:hypothetical protein
MHALLMNTHVFVQGDLFIIYAQVLQEDDAAGNNFAAIEVVRQVIGTCTCLYRQGLVLYVDDDIYVPRRSAGYWNDWKDCISPDTDEEWNSIREGDLLSLGICPNKRANSRNPWMSMFLIPRDIIEHAVSPSALLQGTRQLSGKQSADPAQSSEECAYAEELSTSLRAAQTDTGRGKGVGIAPGRGHHSVTNSPQVEADREKPELLTENNISLITL